MATETKWIGRSMTIWGSIISAIPILATIFGWRLSDFGIDLAVLDAAGRNVLMGADALVGLGLTWYGRYRAKSPVSILPKLPLGR